MKLWEKDNIISPFYLFIYGFQSNFLSFLFCNWHRIHVFSIKKDNLKSLLILEIEIPIVHRFSIGTILKRVKCWSTTITHASSFFFPFNSHWFFCLQPKTVPTLSLNTPHHPKVSLFYIWSLLPDSHLLPKKKKTPLVYMEGVRETQPYKAPKTQTHPIQPKHKATTFTFGPK